jgi:hypothetical protein
MLQRKALNKQERRSNPPTDETSEPTMTSEEVQEIRHNGADPFAFLDAFHEQDVLEWDDGESPNYFWN